MCCVGCGVVVWSRMCVVRQQQLLETAVVVVVVCVVPVMHIDTQQSIVSIRTVLCKWNEVDWLFDG